MGGRPHAQSRGCIMRSGPPGSVRREGGGSSPSHSSLGGDGGNPRLRVSSQRATEAPLAAAPCPPALQLLLKDPAPAVRMKAAETLGRLVKFA